MMQRGCENDQERQELHNVIMVEEAARAADLQDDDLPDWMKQSGAVPAWFGRENPEQAQAFVQSLPKQST